MLTAYKYMRYSDIMHAVYMLYIEFRTWHRLHERFSLAQTRNTACAITIVLRNKYVSSLMET